MSQDHQPFVHLHVHSEFSLLDGLSRIDHLAKRARELNMPALALTDHGTMHGTVQFYRSCRRAGVKPILGVESYLASRRLSDKEHEKDRTRYHLLLLAQNQAGYQNLLKLVSTAQLQGFYYRPRIDRDYLAAHSEGLITTTGCMAGEIPQAIKLGNMRKANKLMGWYADLFGRDRFFVELQEHNIPELREINKKLIELAGRYDLRFLATNDVHYTTAEEAGPHDVLLCIQTGKSLGAQDRMRMSDQSYYLKSHEEMARLFGEVPGALDNSLLIAEMCEANPEPEGYHLPHFDVPDGYTPGSYLRHLCEQGLVWRYGQERTAGDEALRRRLDHELKIIGRMGFDAYFLIVWDLCEFARREDIWWNVRGSGAGSVVAFTLGITGIDPLENGLIFERFLNPGRVSMPDIDLDYPDDRRHEMIEYAVEKYGSDKVAQIITFGTMGARAAIRDVGRALEVPLPEVDALAKLIRAIPGKPVTIGDALTAGHEFYSPELAQRYKDEEIVRQLVDTAQSLEGVARHASTHAAGVIISDQPLVAYTPLHRPTRGGDSSEGIGVVTQWPMEILDSIGLLKVDFLGLSTLTVLREAAKLIDERYDVRYTMENIPYDAGQRGPDPEKKPELLFEMLGRGDVAGVFQVEGTGMRRLMMQMRPTRFDHIIAAISLYRPGPMENIPDYVARMHGEKEVKFHHPDLAPILQDTFGILVYQEQIIRIASEFAGYAPGEADMIRKAVAKKKRDLMDKHRTQFTEGAINKGYALEVIDSIWGDIEFFARYGFNKAHAADYAVITCQTAFLKAHYPVEYMTALLSVERNNTEKVAQYLAEARRMGITVAPADINRADLGFSIEGDNKQPVIRYGLGAIKNAGTAAIELLMDDRQVNGPFRDLADLCQRVDLRRVGKRALESMIKVGVFDGWGSRIQLLDALDRILAHSGKIHDAAAVGQMSLFGSAMGMELDVAVELLRSPVELPTVDRREVLDWEKELVGVYISEHPLDGYVNLLKEVVSANTADLITLADGRGVTLVGLLTYLRTHVTKRGEAMAFGSLEDLHGTVELVFFPSVWKRYRSLVAQDRVFVVRGKVRIENGDRAKILVEQIDNNLNVAKAAPIDWDDTNSRSKALDIGQPAADTKEKIVREPGVISRPGSGQDPLGGYKAGGKPSLHERTSGAQSEMAASSYTPPPPPNFETDDDNWLTGPDVDELNGTKPAEQKWRAGKSSFAPVEKETGQAPSGAAVDDGPVERPKTVVVEILASGDWRETCRRLVRIAGQYNGRDRLRISIVDQKLVMDFPNLVTQDCPELRRQIKQLAAINRVEAV